MACGAPDCGHSPLLKLLMGGHCDKPSCPNWTGKCPSHGGRPVRRPF